MLKFPALTAQLTKSAYFPLIRLGKTSY